MLVVTQYVEVVAIEILDMPEYPNPRNTVFVEANNILLEKN